MNGFRRLLLLYLCLSFDRSLGANRGQSVSVRVKLAIGISSV